MKWEDSIYDTIKMGVSVKKNSSMLGSKMNSGMFSLACLTQKLTKTKNG